MPRHKFEAVRTVVSDYTVILDDSTLLCNGTLTITLPAGVKGRDYTVKNIGTGIVTVDASGAETIDGETTQTLSQWDSMTITTDGSNWHIV